MSDVTPKALLAALDARDGHRCAWTGREGDTLVPQHRQGGMGGRRGKHRLSNVVWLDSIINGRIEAEPDWQLEAFERGIKIRSSDDPTQVEVRHAVHGLVLLGDLGEVIPVWPPAGKGPWS
jgi:hypothetical protein